MFIPKRGTPGRTVVETIHEHGPLTFEQAVEIHHLFALYRSRTMEVYTRAVDSGWLTVTDGVYALTPEMKTYLDSCVPQEKPKNVKPVLAVQPAQFKPLSLDRLPSLQARRGDAQPARRIYFLPATPKAEPFFGEDKPASGAG